jgi:hypothetical protein
MSEVFYYKACVDNDGTIHVGDLTPIKFAVLGEGQIEIREFSTDIEGLFLTVDGRHVRFNLPYLSGRKKYRLILEEVSG